MNLHIAYLTLQATKEGQAAYAHVHEIIKGLEKRCIDVDLYEPTYAPGPPPGAFRRLIEFIWVQGSLLFQLTSYQAVYIRSHFAAWPLALICHILRIPVIQEVNGTHEDLFVSWPLTKKFSGIFKLLINSQLGWAQGVITVTHQLAEWVREGVHHSNVMVISNAANTDLFRPMESNGDEKYVIFFGALSVWQGVDLMIESVRHENWPSSICLYVVGDGAERIKVQRAASEIDKVKYLGPRNYQELPAIVAQSMAGLCPKVDVASHSKTGLMPLKLFEIMASGVPVIVTDFPGQADVVRQHDCGVVIPQDDPAALASAVHSLLKHPEEWKLMGKSGRDAAVAFHSWDARADSTAQVLRVLIKGGSR